MEEKNNISKISEYESITCAEDIAKARKLVSFLINRLENDIDRGDPLDENFFGKENPVSLLTKLTQMLLKLIPVEIEMLDMDDENKEINKQDLEILERYARKYLEKQKTA